MADFTLLNHEQLRLLARILYYKETEAIMNIKFNSEPDRAKYLRDCKACYQSALGLLDAGSELESRFQNDDARASIAREIFGYTVNAANYALQTVRNYGLRMNCVEKISEHVHILGHALEVMDDIIYVAKEATEYRKAMLEYTRRHLSPTSRQFSRWLKGSGIKFEGLVQRYQVKLKYQGHFKDLKDVQKIQVYEEIIEAAGRGSVKVNLLSKFLKVAGKAVLLFAAGVMVWEIFSADNPIQKATYNSVVTAASFGGAILGEVVGVALASCITASAAFVVAVGIIASLAGAFILGAFAGWLVDLIFESGGSAVLSTEGLRYYVAPMPDGIILARQLMHRRQPKY